VRPVEIARDHPIFGVGVHRYQAVCLDERYGPALVGPAALPRCEGHPHNLYLQWLAETGAVGLAGYCAFVVLSLAAIWRRARGAAADAVLHGLAAALVLRFWPLSAGTSFYSTWSAEPLFLLLGWALSYGPALRFGSARPAAADRETLHAS
jgi:O-antigen ligase